MHDSDNTLDKVKNPWEFQNQPNLNDTKQQNACRESLASLLNDDRKCENVVNSFEVSLETNQPFVLSLPHSKCLGNNYWTSVLDSLKHMFMWIG